MAQHIYIVLYMNYLFYICCKDYNYFNISVVSMMLPSVFLIYIDLITADVNHQIGKVCEMLHRYKHVPLIL